MDSSTNTHPEVTSRPSRFLPPVSLVAGAFGLAASPALAAAPPEICKKGFDPFKASAATRATCGVTSFPLQSKITHPDGSTEYTYVIYGHPAKTLIPPPSFHPATASPAELARFGIPREPPATSPSARRDWEKLVHKMHFVTPPPALFSLPVHHSYTSPNWSGWFNLDSGNASAFQTADATYTEPSDQGTGCSNTAASFWAGLGAAEAIYGGTPGDLVQDGTQIGSAFGGPDDYFYHRAWTEIYPVEPTEVAQPIKATAGKSFEAYVEWTGTSAGYSNYYFFLENLWTGDAWSFYDQSPHAFDGHTAEYIAEAPGFGNTTAPLTNFGTWQEGSSYTNGYAAQLYNHYPIDMNRNGDLLDTTYDFTNSDGGFNVGWQNCL